MNAAELDLGILAPALLAGLIVLATHVPLGQQVLDRGIIFIDLAIAQIAGLGVIAAHALGWAADGWPVQLTAAGAALAGALALYSLERRLPAVQEAVIGSAFILAASASVLLLAANPRGGEHLRDLLAGQILWVSTTPLLAAAALTLALLIAWFAPRASASPLRFYVVFALAVTASVQLVGVYLVFASLILPALATRRLRGAARLRWGYATGIAGYLTGMAISVWLDLPTGATIVWTLAATAVVVAYLANGTENRQAPSRC